MTGKNNIMPGKRLKPNLVLEIIIIFGGCVAVYLAAAHYDIIERIVAFSSLHENLEIDEILTISVFLVIALTFFAMRRLRELSKSEMELMRRNKQLQNALSEIKELKGIIPICASCKKIRDDKGFWQQVEVFVRDHTNAEFSHGICPDCMVTLYPDVFDGERKD